MPERRDPQPQSGEQRKPAERPEPDELSKHFVRNFEIESSLNPLKRDD